MIFYDQIFNNYVTSCDINYDTNITLFSQLFLTEESTPNKKYIIYVDHENPPLNKTI